ncbi:unnamed protein product [Nezara viridula]|uniref:Neurotransmitter-gated ion-channel ligand-binding domain-containing protein n=1 Tax=Nezara viridula TaxID=85310 RepID=A0A9P0HUQ0_NEZVI|nr:unnamed protein product [Nezara viridula]
MCRADGCLLYLSVCLTLVLANPEARRLYDDLLSNYNRLIRPVGNNSDRLTVKMGLRLSQLIDVGANFVQVSQPNLLIDFIKAM